MALNLFHLGVLFPLGALNNVSSNNIHELAVQYNDAVFLDVWLQATGTLLSTVFFVVLVTLTGATYRLAGWMTMIASTLILVIGHVENLFTLTAVLTAQREHIETAMLAFDFAAGNRAFGTLFYMVAVPALYLSQGSVL